MYECSCLTVERYKKEYAFDYSEYDYKSIKWDKHNDKDYAGFITFDIETSRYKKNTEEFETFLYQWQLCINNDVIFGQTWDSLLKTFNNIKETTTKKVVVYVHNLAYEFQFMKDFLEFENVFSIDEHTILKCTTTKGLEFRCSYKLSNMNLQKFIENTPNHYFIKGVGDLDYSVLRTPTTKLTSVEYGYCYNDVRGLYFAIEHLLEEDTLKSIPLTSTGYVRRDCRNACKTSNDRNRFKKSTLDIQQYHLLIEAFRGGNTASNRYHTNTIIKNVNSYDISSSYPFVMMTEKYPIGRFMKATIESYEELKEYNKKYCTLGRYSFINIRLKNGRVNIPYLSYSKCNKVDKNALCYNGRVMQAEFLETVITNVDFEIIESMYEYDEMYIDDFMFSRKKLLSASIRNTILKYFQDKTLLKGDKEQYYFYMKQKNKLNSIYGMFVSAIVRDSYYYDSDENRLQKMTKSLGDEKAEMDKYNKSYNSFLNYQCGIWVTAYARRRLQKLIDLIGIDVVYCDTDSVKYINNHDEAVEKLNNEVYEIEKSIDIPFWVEKNGEKVYMGLWDKEEPYDEFITMGAKKYAYSQNGKLGVTVSGLNKKNAPIELKEKGGLEAFKQGTVFVNSGRVTVEYHHDKIHYITVNGEKIKTGSYINMFDTTYTLGISDTMLNIINDSLLH